MLLILNQFSGLTPGGSAFKDFFIGMERMVSVLHDIDHYTVLEFGILRWYIKVYDDLCGLTSWEKRIVNVFK